MVTTTNKTTLYVRSTYNERAAPHRVNSNVHRSDVELNVKLQCAVKDAPHELSLIRLEEGTECYPTYFISFNKRLKRKLKKTHLDVAQAQRLCKLHNTIARTKLQLIPHSDSSHIVLIKTSSHFWFAWRFSRLRNKSLFYLLQFLHQIQIVMINNELGFIWTKQKTTKHYEFRI